MIYTHPITEDRAQALRERNLDALHAALVSGGCYVDGVTLSLDPPSIKVSYSGGTSPEFIINTMAFPERRNRKSAEDILRTFATGVRDGGTPTNRQIGVAFVALLTVLELD